MQVKGRLRRMEAPGKWGALLWKEANACGGGRSQVKKWRAAITGGVELLAWVMWMGAGGNRKSRGDCTASFVSPGPLPQSGGFTRLQVAGQECYLVVSTLIDFMYSAYRAEQSMLYFELAEIPTNGVKNLCTQHQSSTLRVRCRTLLCHQPYF